LLHSRVCGRFYGLLDRELQVVVEFYLSREQAERDLAAVLRDEPAWAEQLAVVLPSLSWTTA
jgi:hypothetical protein